MYNVPSLALPPRCPALPSLPDHLMGTPFRRTAMAGVFQLMLLASAAATVTAHAEGAARQLLQSTASCAVRSGCRGNQPRWWTGCLVP